MAIKTSYKEIWRDIEDYIGIYQISNFGEVKNVKTGYMMAKILTQTGYLRVDLSKNGKVKHRTIHSLVADHFLANPEHKPEINHIDFDRTNNHISNLEWCTHKENQEHSWLAGRWDNMPKGKEHWAYRGCGIGNYESKVTIIY
jgi:NUMOD4 motif./HNH endonuclease.